MSEQANKLAEFTRGQRSIAPAIPFGQIRVVVLCAQHNFERPPTTHQPCEMLGAAGARNHTKCWLELTEDRRFASKTHVAREYEFASDAAYTTLNLRDGD